MQSLAFSLLLFSRRLPDRHRPQFRLEALRDELDRLLASCPVPGACRPAPLHSLLDPDEFFAERNANFLSKSYLTSRDPFFVNPEDFPKQLNALARHSFLPRIVMSTPPLPNSELK